MQQVSYFTSDADDSDGELWVEEGCNHYQQLRTSESSTGDDKAYIDSCTRYSTIDEQYLEDVRVESVSLQEKCNAGVMVLNKTGKLGDLSVWSRAKDQGIANLISLPALEIFLRKNKNGGRLTYDSDGEWVLTLKNETRVIQREADGPLPVCLHSLSVAGTLFKIKLELDSASVTSAFAALDVPALTQVHPNNASTTGTPQVSWAAVAGGRTGVRFVTDGSAPPRMTASADTKNQVHTADLAGAFHRFRHTSNEDILRGGSFMQETVSGNMERFSKRQVEGAKRARALQVMKGNPPVRLFRELVRDNRLYNCNVSLDDVTNALAIYGQSRAVLRGGSTSTRRKPRTIKTGYDIEIPRDFFQLHRFVI